MSLIKVSDVSKNYKGGDGVLEALKNINLEIAEGEFLARIVSVILFLASSLVVTMTMKASVEERTREIGILRAIGFRKRHIIQVILTEASLLGSLGGLLGYLLGMSAAVQYGSLLVKTQGNIPWQANLLAYVMLSSLIISLLASLNPAWHAARLDPTDSLCYM